MAWQAWLPAQLTTEYPLTGAGSPPYTSPVRPPVGWGQPAGGLFVLTSAGAAPLSLLHLSANCGVRDAQ
jgi:hypothetical protein